MNCKQMVLRAYFNVYIFFLVMSNDELYGCDREFIDVLEKHATNICQELLVVLKALGDAKENKKQCNLALDLFWRIIRRGDVSDGSMASLAMNLWSLSKKHQDSNNKYAVCMLLRKLFLSFHTSYFSMNTIILNNLVINIYISKKMYFTMHLLP